MSATMLRADAGRLPLADGSVDLVVTSPPYNVGIDYDVWDDTLPWDDYWRLVDAWSAEIVRALKPTGRCFLNVAPVVQEEPGGSGRNGQRRGPPRRREYGSSHSGRSSKRRQSLAARWTVALERAGLEPADMVAWTSMRGSGTAWGSWQTPSAPNLRGGWEAVLVHFKESWPREQPEGMEGYRDGLGGWPDLVSNVWDMPMAPRNGHPAPFPPELPRRAILLSTWPGDVVLDPFAGSGTTLRVAHELGRVGVGCDLSEAYCRRSMARGFQGALDLLGEAFTGLTEDVVVAGEVL